VYTTVATQEACWWTKVPLGYVQQNPVAAQAAIW